MIQDINDTWRTVLYSEFHRGRDRDRFIEDEEEGDYPVYQGENIHRFCYNPTYVDNLDSISLWSGDDEHADKSAEQRVREKNVRARDAAISLMKAIYNEFTDDSEFSHISASSQKRFVNTLLTEESDPPELSPEIIRLHSTEYRLVLGEVARATDERT